MTEWFICNSTTELESAAFSLYPQLMPIGPLLASNRLANQTGHFWQEDSTCLAWLDQQPPSSVIYIAFGSFTIFNQTQFQELALGLELSNKPFLWVVRPSMTKETTAAYPWVYRKSEITWKNRQLGATTEDEAGIITREEIKSKIEQLLSDKTFREKALDMKDKIRSSVNGGGCSHFY
ncbi:hypothetical protein Tco_1407029 [Tanacetum coccineum]